MFATTVFILILFLPAAFLPLTLSSFTSDTELEKMGVSLENTDDTFPMQGYDPAGFLPTSNHSDVWEINELLQTCQ